MTKEVKGLSEIIKDVQVPREFREKKMKEADKLKKEAQEKYSKAEKQAQELEKEVRELEKKAVEAQKNHDKLKEEKSDDPSESIIREWNEYQDYFASEIMDSLIEKLVSLKAEYEKTVDELISNFEKIRKERQELSYFMRQNEISGWKDVEMNVYQTDQERIMEGIVKDGDKLYKLKRASGLIRL